MKKSVSKPVKASAKSAKAPMRGSKKPTTAKRAAKSK